MHPNRVRTTINEHEVAVIDHLRGNCHNGSECAICIAERARNDEIRRLNSIIQGD